MDIVVLTILDNIEKVMEMKVDLVESVSMFIVFIHSKFKFIGIKTLWFGR